ncbi:HAMP domain-containing sensor histidine kinase [uncultured Abyssibacter sp.]|uniref:sensor histidine kinase n=1 Tax=uncultured Abyssibacter sp. TaxID=2320202 RepID=UPI0032B1A293
MRLHTEILLSMLGLGAVLLVVLGSSLLIYSERLENDLLSNTVNDEIEFLLQQLRTSVNPVLPETDSLKIWIDAEDFVYAPAPFHDLALGEHHDVTYLGKRWHILRRDSPYGLLTAAVDVSRIEAREHQMRVLLALTAIGVAALGGLMAVWLSRRLAAPVAALAGSVDKLDPRHAEALHARFGVGELGTIAEAIDGLVERVRRMLERERFFTAAVSHEIRTPLAVIQSSLDLAQIQQPDTASSPAIARAQRASQGLGDLLDSLLFLAREDSMPTTRPTDVATEAHEVMALLETRMQGVDTAVIEQAPCTIEAAPSHVRTVLMNLLRNARQHTSSGRITVEVDASGVSVCDTGTGLPAGDFDELLKPYVSSDEATTQEPRFGVGLYIVSRICAHYGWRLSAQNQTPIGTRVRIDFPPGDSAPDQTATHAS